MMDDRIEGALKAGFGHVQDAAGGLTGDSKSQLAGKANEAAGSLENAYGQVKDQAQHTLEGAKEQVRHVHERLEDKLGGRPLFAIGIGIGLGFVLAHLVHEHRQVEYVRR